MKTTHEIGTREWKQSDVDTTPKPPIRLSPRQSAPKLGLVGFGEVGRTFYEAIESGLLCGASIGRVVVKDKAKPRSARVNGEMQELKFRSGILTNDFGSILEDTEIDLMVDCSNEPSPALIEAALRMRIPVVTANKAVIARYGNYLFRLAARHGVALRCEACVCAEVPIVRAISNYHRHHGLREIEGVLNGTSNFVLTSMEQNGADYDSALREAQARGFAEADPMADVTGLDSANKLLILTALGCGVPLLDPRFHDLVLRDSIEGILPPAFALARKFSGGQTIKLLAQAENEDGVLALRVMPTLVERNTLIGATQGARNAIVITKKFGGVSEMSGLGAGGEPTASAMLADVVKVLNDLERGIPPFNYGHVFDAPAPRVILPQQQTVRPVFQSVSPEHEIGVLARKLDAIAQAGLSVEQPWNDAASRNEWVADYVACEPCTYQAAQNAAAAMERIPSVKGGVKILNIGHDNPFA